MANPLTATLVSTRTQKNRAQRDDTITFQFASPPQTATDVLVEIQQGQVEDADGVVVPGSRLAEFRGTIQNGKYVPSSANALKPPKVTHLPIKLTDGAKVLNVALPDSLPVVRHELQITVSGKVAGTREFFHGRAALFVDYLQAMIVPTQTARLDTSLNVISDWAKNQWQKHDPQVRNVQTVRTLRSPRGALAPAMYDPLIAAFAAAVGQVPGGIIALAIGHGDGGQGNPDGADAWCDIMPEDEPLVHLPNGATQVPHTMFVSNPILLDGATKGKFPTGDNAVILNTLDRIADELAKATKPIRKLLLHTCNAGNNLAFLQLFADRLQVPVQAQTDFIAYSGFIGKGHVRAHYDSDQPQPIDETEWPLLKASVEAIPGKAPRRFPVA